MKKAVSLLLLLAVVLSLPSCAASPKETKTAEDFLSGLTALDSADPVEEMNRLLEVTAPVITIRAKAFDFRDNWEEKTNEYEKYVHIYGSGGVVSVYVSRNRVEKVTYTFCVDSKTDIFNAAHSFIALYGDPATVTLNGAFSSMNDVKKAIAESDDPDLRYNFKWTPNLKGKSLSLYMAYYYADGVNFAYVVISVPDEK